MNRVALVRTASAAFGGWGAVLLVAPERMTRLACGGGPEPRTWVVRLLGGRLVAQHGLLLARPERRLVLAGAAVDAVHALSMLAVAAAWRDHRRPASVSAATALASAAVGLLAAPAAVRS